MSKRAADGAGSPAKKAATTAEPFVIGLADVEAAAKNIEGFANMTPVMTSGCMDGIAGRELFFKCELFQKVGAFKFRGAYNAISKMGPEVSTIITHSSGNHAQAIALAAKMAGKKAHIVMPSDAPVCKRKAVEGYGAQITTCEPNSASRVAMAAKVEEETPNSAQIPSYNHPDVMAGQGTTALELLDQVENLDALIIPVGGGGLLSGMCIGAKGRNPNIKIYAAEPKEADDCARSFAAKTRIPLDGPPSTIADGLKTSLGTYTWPIIRDSVEAVITVDEKEIVAATRLVYERMKLVIEPSAGVPTAVALGEEFRKIADEQGLKRVGVVLCGGNQDLDALPWLNSPQLN